MYIVVCVCASVCVCTTMCKCGYEWKTFRSQCLLLPCGSWVFKHHYKILYLLSYVTNPCLSFLRTIAMLVAHQHRVGGVGDGWVGNTFSHSSVALVLGSHSPGSSSTQWCNPLQGHCTRCTESAENPIPSMSRKLRDYQPLKLDV